MFRFFIFLFIVFISIRASTMVEKISLTDVIQKSEVICVVSRVKPFESSQLIAFRGNFQCIPTYRYRVSEVLMQSDSDLKPGQTITVLSGDYTNRETMADVEEEFNRSGTEIWPILLYYESETPIKPSEEMEILFLCKKDNKWVIVENDARESILQKNKIIASIKDLEIHPIVTE